MNPKAFGLSLAATVGMFFIGCTAFSRFAPVQYTRIFESWYHVAATKPPEAAPFDFGQFALGLVTSSLVAGLIGWVWASLYNAWNAKAGRA